MHAVVFCVAIQLKMKNSWLNSRLCVLVFMCVNVIFIHMVLIQYNNRGFESLQEQRENFQSSPGSSFCADSYFRIRLNPRVAAVMK